MTPGATTGASRSINDATVASGRAPNFQQFRLRDKKELERYLEGCERDENAPPSMRANGAGRAGAKGNGGRARKGTAAKAAKGTSKSKRS